MRVTTREQRRCPTGESEVEAYENAAQMKKSQNCGRDCSRLARARQTCDVEGHMGIHTAPHFSGFSDIAPCAVNAVREHRTTPRRRSMTRSARCSVAQVTPLITAYKAVFSVIENPIIKVFFFENLWNKGFKFYMGLIYYFHGSHDTTQMKDTLLCSLCVYPAQENPRKNQLV